MMLRSRLFWKFFLSMMSVLLLTGLLSIQFERYVAKNQSQSRIDDSINQLLDFREKLAEELSDGDIEAAAELLLVSPNYNQQFLLFDEYGNEILGREKHTPSKFNQYFYQTLKQEFEQRNIQLNIVVNSYLGNRYYIEMSPMVLFQPLFSPRLAGTLLRFALFILLTGLVGYFLTRTLTRRIRQLQYATRQLSDGHYRTAFGDNYRFSHDELGELGKDFQQMVNKLNEASQARKQILSDISHELRSPLARMHVALEIANNKNPNAKPQLQRIEKEAERMNQLIGQIIHLQQLQMGQFYQQSDYQPILINEFIQEIIDNVGYEYQQIDKHIDFIPCPASPQIQGDKEQLSAALENIIRNAISHTAEQTHVSIQVSTDKNQLHITVTDCGEGITEVDDLNKIFQPFTRLDSSRNRQTGGYGLGLSIAKAIIENHNGSIVADNRKDGKRGLVMTIVLPF